MREVIVLSSTKTIHYIFLGDSLLIILHQY